METSESKKKVFTPRSIFGIVMGLSILTSACAYNVQESNRKQFESLSVTLADNITIEYGSKDVDLEKYIKKSKGNVTLEKNTIDSMDIGKSEVLLNVEEGEANRTYSLKVEVKDTNKPVVELKSENVTLDYDQKYDVNTNIVGVSDVVDGDLTKSTTDGANNYTVTSNLDTSKAGTYTVTVVATDKNNNKTEKTFNVKVKEKPVPVAPAASSSDFKPGIYPTYVANDETPANKVGIVKLAYSLLGSRYVYGGNTPAGFDCSGFVNYVYGQNGISVSKSSSALKYAGTGVSYSEMRPGDIIVWGYGSSPTHVSIYVGGGNMIHAANPRKGVIHSSVSAWATYGTNIITIRRI